MSLLPGVRRKVTIVLASVLLALIGIGVGAWAAQGRLIFPVPAGARLPGAHQGELLRLPGDRGETVALWLEGPAGAPVAVHFHGNGEELADVADWARQLQQAGMGALAVEYPGYGLARASGPPSEEGCYASAEAALAWLREKKGVPAERTVLVGHSLGSAVAAEMAVRRRGARLVLLSPFTAVADMGKRLFPFLPVGLLVRHRFDTLGKASRIDLPTLVVHGARDDVAPVSMGERLARTLPNARFVVLQHAGHDLIWPKLGPLAECLRAFAAGEECPALE